MNKISEALDILRPLANTSEPKSNSANRGKIRKDLISFNLLSEAFQALDELDKALDSNRKISADLLVRYIFEIEMDFLYLFKVKKGQQNLCDAYFYFGDIHQASVIKDGNPEPHKLKWLKALGKKSANSKNHWSGLSRAELVKATKNESESGISVLYKIFSGFTHPNIFTLERTLESTSNIYKKYSEINKEFPAYIVTSMFLFASEKNLYGLSKAKLTKSKVLLGKFLQTAPLHN